MDPGNWATDLAGGSSFGYLLLFIILLSNAMAVVLQGLAVKLGVVSGLGNDRQCQQPLNCLHAVSVDAHIFQSPPFFTS